MKCCEKDMLFLYIDTRGRWEKEIYVCEVCKQRQRKRINLISNRIGRW